MSKVIVIYLHLFIPQVHYTQSTKTYHKPVCTKQKQVKCHYSLAFEKFKHDSKSQSLTYEARVRAKSHERCWTPPSAVYRLKIKREAYLVVFKPITKTYNSYYCR